MNDEDTLKEVDDTREEPLTEQKKENTEETEFKVTVRKLEVPVRPRGVLAE
jgi:hypothetical protein